MKKILFLIILLSFLHSYADAQIALTGNITTIGVSSYPTHIDSLGKGGYMAMPTIAARDGIPTLRRKYGMLVYVQATDVLYRLGSITLDNSNWVEVSLLSATTNIQTFLASPTSANLSAAVTNDVGTGSLVFSNTPTLSNATLSGTLTLTAPLTAANGGTGASTYAKGDVLYASATNSLSKLTIGSTGQVLTVNSGVPSWGSNGIFTLNTISAASQIFTTTSSGSDFTISSGLGTGTLSNTAIHSFNLPDATETTRGLLSATNTQNIGGNKDFKGTVTMTSNLITNGNLVSKNFKLNQFSDPNGSQYTVGSVMTSSDANGSAQWSTNLNVGTITATSLTTGALKLTSSIPTVGAVLTATATDGTVGWSTTNSASSLYGGVAGAIPFQTAPSATGFTAAGTSGQILVSAGTATPTWTSNITVGTVTATSLVTNTLNVTAGTYTTSGAVLTSDGNGNAVWGSNGLYTLNGITAAAQTFSTTNIKTSPVQITSSVSGGTATHTFNIPDADFDFGTSLGSRGLLNDGTSLQQIAGNKQFRGNVTASSMITNTLQVTGGSYTTTGAVLTSDGNGNATWGSNGLFSLNGQSAITHTFATANTASADFTITTGLGTGTLSRTALHTFNLPNAGTSTRGIVSTGDQTFAGIKSFSSDIVSNGIHLGKGNYTGINSNLSIGFGGKNFNANTSTSLALNNIAIGKTVLTSLTNGSYNNALGHNALNANTTGSYNNAFGFEALKNNKLGSYNTAIGESALLGNNGDYASYNTAVGFNSLVSNTTGEQNTAIGSSSNVGSAGLTNATAIGYGAIVRNDNTIQLGNTSVTSVVTSGTLSATGATVTTLNATGATVTTLNATGATLTGNLTATSANFSRAVTGAPAAAFTSTTATTINFSGSNLAYSGQSSNIFTLSNLRDGGTYTLAWQNTTTGLKATFSATGFTFIDLGNYTVVTNKHAVYTFMVLGTTVYFTMISQI